MLKKMIVLVFGILFFSTAFAAEEPADAVNNDYQYFSIEPDIITNYIKPGKRIGFLRLSVEVMVKSKSDYGLVDNNEPLVRDRIITILGEQTEKDIKSIDQRDAIRARCVEEINALLLAETEKKPVIDILFTKYLYQ